MLKSPSVSGQFKNLFFIWRAPAIGSVKKLMQEFANLTMGSMTVDEYYQKFIELMRFAPHVVPTEEMKATKFELGLSMDLQEKLGGFNFTCLETVYGQVA